MYGQSISKDSFELVEVKSKDRVSLYAEWVATIKEGDSTFKPSDKPNSPIPPHPDLLQLLDKLKPRLAEAFGYGRFEKLIGSTPFNASAYQKKAAKKFFDEFIKTELRVTGIKVAGKSAKGIVIKGTFNGCAINTKTLYFTNNEYGADLQEIKDALEDEVYQYIFDGKKGQQVLFDGPADDKKEKDLFDQKGAASGEKTPTDKEIAADLESVS